MRSEECGDQAYIRRKKKQNLSVESGANSHAVRTCPVWTFLSLYKSRNYMEKCGRNKRLQLKIDRRVDERKKEWQE